MPIRIALTCALLLAMAVGLRTLIRPPQDSDMLGGPLPSARPARLIWALLPALIFNVIWFDRLPEGYGGDAGVPTWLLWSEHGLRFATFGSAAFVRERTPRHVAAWSALALGTAVYFASWIPLLVAPASASHPAIALGPAVTPALWLGAAAWLGRSTTWALLAAAFLALHIAHQLV